jgi:hypothetical protein
LSISIREACRRFLDDLDETVPQPAFERYAKALDAFTTYLDDVGVVEIDRLSMEHVGEFLLAGYPVEEASVTEVGDLWTALKRFVKWLDQRRLLRLWREFRRAGFPFREDCLTPVGVDRT